MPERDGECCRVTEGDVKGRRCLRQTEGDVEGQRIPERERGCGGCQREEVRGTEGVREGH